MRVGNSRFAVASRFGGRSAPVKFFRISQLRRLCECEKVAAVCYRINGHGIEFLLVQTRGGRWTFPKGTVEPGLTHAQSAALEAYEEAGVHGRMEEASFGQYVLRSGARCDSRGVVVNTHLCEVSRLETPLERKRHPTWFSPEETKRHLRKGRAIEEGAEMCRVVARAFTRIQRLRDLTSAPNLRMLEGVELDGRTLSLQQPASQKKDVLQKVEFTVVERARQDKKEPALSIVSSRKRIPSVRLLRARNS
jgi:8-oxo-dGTP pyrophosphatase MutT (NUDIX family)